MELHWYLGSFFLCRNTDPWPRSSCLAVIGSSPDWRDTNKAETGWIYFFTQPFFFIFSQNTISIYICVHKPMNDGRISSNFINLLNLDDIAAGIIKFFRGKKILTLCSKCASNRFERSINLRLKCA